MQPKKRSGPRGASAQELPGKGQGPRRPIGVQALGPVRYEELRRALVLLTVLAER